MGQFTAGIVIVICLAILVAWVFTKNQFAGVGCILALAIMACGGLGIMSLALMFHH